MTSAQVSPSPFKGQAFTVNLVVFNSRMKVEAEDFEIGPIAPRARSPQGGPVDVAARFLDSLGKKKPEYDLVAENERVFMQRSLRAWIGSASALVKFRLSYPDQRSVDRAVLNVRAYGKGGAAEGEIVMAREADSWKVESLALNLDAIEIPRKPREGPYEPQIYRVTGM